ncbi:10537_t:CDS:10 [Ambispora gerdemannii]|uniref:10537_t:CDS:1 n=1 Tax=Ambispora gerdemannii TaxID=144530 RepID=A0A9N8ZKS9_9GLOM|nr:10537_t:CDS:10 [Ambispora gerdemannii]
MEELEQPLNHNSRRSSIIEIQEKYNVKITFSLEKQTFELRGIVLKQLHDARKEIQRILLNKSSSANQISVIPPRRKQIDATEKFPSTNLRPLNDDEFEKHQPEEDTEGLEKPFLIDNRIEDIEDLLGTKNVANQNSNYWKDICKDCGVEGDVIIDRRRIMVNGSKISDIEEAMNRLRTLQMIYLRPPFKTQKIPLIHYPNQNMVFKLLFYPLKKHAYFKDKFSAVKLIDPHILVAVRQNAEGEYNLLPNELDIGLLPPQNKAPAILKLSAQSNMKGQETNWPAEQQTQIKTLASSTSEFSSSDSPDLLAKNSVPHNNTQRPISYRGQSLERPGAAPSTQQNSVNDDFKHPNPSQSQGFEETRQSPKPSDFNDEFINRALKTEEEKQARKEAKKARIAKMKYERIQETLNNSNENTFPPGSNTRVLVENEAEKKSNEQTELKPKLKKIVMEKSPDTSGPFDYQPITFGKRVRNYNFEQMKKAFTEAFDHARSHKGEIRFHGSIGKVTFSGVTPQINSKLWEFTDVKDILVGELGVFPGFTDTVTEDPRFIQLLYENLSMRPSAKTAFFEINAISRNNKHSEYIPVTMFVNCDYVALGKVTLCWEHLVDVDWSILDRRFDFQMCLKTRKFIRHDVKPFSTFMKKTSVHPASRMITFENIEDYLEVKSISFKQVINDVIREKIKDNVDLGAGKLGNWTVEDILGEEPGLLNLVELTKTMLMLIERCHKVAENRADEEAYKIRKKDK